MLNASEATSQMINALIRTKNKNYSQYTLFQKKKKKPEELKNYLEYLKRFSNTEFKILDSEF